MKNNYSEFIEIYHSRVKYEAENKFVWNRYYLDNYLFNKRVDFVKKLIKDSVKGEFLLEIRFWDDTKMILDFFKNLKNKNYLLEEYKGGEKPGIIIVDDRDLDVTFFSDLLQCHFNYEQAEDPSLNIKILLFTNSDINLKVYDFYDDRGFIVNYYYK